MKRHHLLTFAFIGILLLFTHPHSLAQTKELYIPAKAMRVPDGNDYNSGESGFSYKRMVQSDNIAYQAVRRDAR